MTKESLKFCSGFLVGYLSFGFLSLSNLFAFVIISNAGKPAYWKDSQIDYQLYNVPKAFKKPISNAFQAWSDVEGASIQFSDPTIADSAPESRDGINSVAWIEEGWLSLSFRPPSQALAVTLSSFNSGDGSILDADIYFNSDTFSWGDLDVEDPDASLVDVQNIATHEVGHLFGLDHSSASILETNSQLREATMYFASGKGEVSRRSLNSDDESGARGLYATNPMNAPVINSIEEMEFGSEIQSNSVVVYRIKGENFSEETSFILTHPSGAFFDSVSRYRTLVSSSEYEVQFDVSSFPAGEATLVAFNHPTALTSSSLSVDSGVDFNNFDSSESSSSGGGGCSVSARASSFPFAFFVFLMISVCLLRRRFQEQK